MYEITKYCAYLQDHFPQHMILRSVTGRLKLKGNAVPELNLPKEMVVHKRRTSPRKRIPVRDETFHPSPQGIPMHMEPDQVRNSYYKHYYMLLISMNIMHSIYNFLPTYY